MSIWADRNIHMLLAKVNELDKRLLAVESRPSGVSDEEPADKRTREWREWRERQTSN